MADNQYKLETTYIYFDVKDYSNRSVLSAYALPICPLTFIPDYTTSELLSSSRALSNKVIKWDFGDDTFSTDLTATKVYTWPGEYKVQLTVFDRYGNALVSEYQPVITVRNFVADVIQWKDYGKIVYDVPASKIGDPLTIITRNSWQSYNVLSGTGITINLYASGAAGDYISEETFFDDKWSHLRLLSRFYEKQTFNAIEQFVIVDDIIANTTEIFARISNDKSEIQICSERDQGAILAGVTGSNDVYYVDDRVKNFTTRENPIFLVASFDAAKFEDEFSQRREIFNYINYPPYGFQNYEPTFLPIIKVRHNPADRISITTTGIDGEGTLSSTVFDIPYISWEKTPVPFVVKFKDFENYTTKTYAPLSSSQANPLVPPQSAYDLSFGLVTLSGEQMTPVKNVTFYEDFPVNAPQNIGGFYKGYFISDQSLESVYLTAGCQIIDPVNFPKDSLIGWISIPQYGYVQRFFREQIYDNCFGGVNMTLTASRAFRKTAPDRNIYAIQVAPSGAGKGRDYDSWLADNVTDTILKFNVLGQTLTAFSLSSMPVLVNGIVEHQDLRNPELSAASPSNIALDGDSNAWITLFDTGISIKLDHLNGYVIAKAFPPGNNIMYLLSSDYTLPELSGFAGEGIFLPSSIDTDLDNNIWVAYSHPVSNFLVQYNPDGVLQTILPFPPVINPVEICIDRDAFAWVTTFNHNTSAITLTGRNDYLYKFTSTGELVSGFPLSGFRMLNNITVDGKQNAWVTEDRETLTKIDRFTLDRTYYTVGSGFNDTTYICSIVGMTCDTADYIWCINQYDSKIYQIDTLLPPESAFRFANKIELTYPDALSSYPVSGYELNQFQAYGDWLGYRWINKYMVPFAIVRSVSGISNVFNVYPTSGVNTFTKVNENWDAESYYKSLRYQEVLLDKEKFFTDFLGGIVGDINSQPYELGKTVYEKIANFVDNKSNITTCNLESLISFCSELSIPFEEYNYPFPPQLERLINLLTIKQRHLWGDKNVFFENFDKKGHFPPIRNYGINLGRELSVLNDVVSSGNPIVAYETFSENYSFVNFSQIPGIPLNITVPLSSYDYNWGWGLVVPRSLKGSEVGNYYKFYEFIPRQEGSFYNNIINWSDPLTTLSPYNSSYNSWSTDNGTMQSLISYELTKGLRLFTSAADITYNN